MQLNIEPALARAGTILEIELVTSAGAAELPRVTVAGQEATASAQGDSGTETTRYVYSYQVEGTEDEGVVPVRAVVRSGRKQEATLERQITLDFTPPTIVGLAGPEQFSPASNATFTFGCSEEGCSYSCLLEEEVGGVMSDLSDCQSGVTYEDLSAGNYSFFVRATDLAGNEGEPVYWEWTVARPARGFVISGIPSQVFAGESLDVTLEAHDELGERARHYTGRVSFTSSDPAALLPADYMFTQQDEGLVTLAGAVVLKSAGLHSITVTDTEWATLTATKEDLEVRPSSATHLYFGVQPVDVIAQEAMVPAVEVEIHDEFGNIVDDAMGTVELTLEVEGGATEAVLSGGNAQASGGVAVFGALSVDLPGAGYSLTAKSSALGWDTSERFEVLDRPEVSLVFPGRLRPSSLDRDLDVEVHGAGFRDGAVVVWDAGGSDEQLLAPTFVSENMLALTFAPSLWQGRGDGAVPVTVELYGFRCEPFSFHIGGVLPDTSQTNCYDASAELLECPQPGESFSGQDAQFGWDLYGVPANRFSRTLDDDYPDHPVVIDHMTRLHWHGCVSGVEGVACDSGLMITRTSQNAYNDCRNLVWAGHNDWRLPTVQELASLIHAGRSSDHYIDEDAFPEVLGSRFWTSNVSPENSSHAWFVGFHDGIIGRSTRSIGRYYRCVRESDVYASYTLLHSAEPVVNEPVVLDAVTSLMWQGCAAGLNGGECDRDSASVHNWAGALSYCQALTWGGYSDWRLPDRNELFSIANYETHGPAIDVLAFPATPSSHFWSSTSVAAGPEEAWRLDFQSGDVTKSPKTDSLRVRCVRRGGAP